MNADELYALLPAVHRIHDERAGGPLKQFLSLFARELEALDESLTQLHEDQFIETCAPWAAPYIGELIGWRPIRAEVSPDTRGLNSPRAEIGNTIALRRRKGTALMLEELASNVTGWPAHAAEFFEQLATTQHLNHLRLHAPATAAVRGLPRLLALRGDAGAFNRVAHLAEVRNPEAGRFNIPDIGLFVWRVRPQRLLDQPLVPAAGDASGRRFTLHPLGIDVALFRRPLAQDGIEQLAGAANVPAPLRIRELALQWHAATAGAADDALDYGAGRSLVLRRGGAVLPLDATLRAADLRDIVDAGGNVIGWAHEGEIGADDIALDPERGRVLLGSALAAAQANDPITATWHYGLLHTIGGGPYAREPAGDGHASQQAHSGAALWQPAIDALGNALISAAVQPSSARLLITDSLAHVETPTLRLPGVTAAGAGGHELVISAESGTRPLLQATAEILLDIGARGTLVLEGLLFSSGRLRVPPAADTEPRTLVLRDCTLREGLVVEDPTLTLRLERCISGPLLVHPLASCELRDSVLDAGSASALAYGAPADDFGAPLTLQACTIVGRVAARELPLASNTIFQAEASGAVPPVQVQRRQQGCVRYSWLPPGAVTPRRHRCQPDARHPGALPQFASLRWGEPLYASLRRASGEALFAGADDGGEIGVMHGLHQTLREANLRVRLQEYLRFGLVAGLFHAT